MKKIITLLVCAVAAITLNATDYTIPSGSPVASWALPIYMGNTTNSAGSFYGCITQQIYLAEDLTSQEASAGNITAATFYYTTRGTSYTATPITPRTIAIYLMESDVDEYPLENFPYKDIYDNTQDKYLSYFLCDDDNKAGVKVFEGQLATVEVTSPTVEEVTLSFNVNNFAWSGTKNIVMTVVDKSAVTHSSSNLRFQIVSTKTDAGTVSHPRFLDTYWSNSSDERVSWINTNSDSYNFSSKLGEFYGTFSSSNLTESSQKSQRSYVPKVKFSISSLTAPDTPTGLAASNIATTSASISWNAASNSTSYELQQSVDGESWSALASSISGTSYNWTSLTANTTYHVRVRAVNAVSNSDWSDGISFTTKTPHIHNGIEFEKWNSTNSLPTSGNYYLDNDVVLGAIATLTGNLNLCLNGHEVYTETYCIKTSNYTLAIYDNVGGGRIYGYFVADYPNYGIINVEIGGTLVLGEGTVENLYGTDPSDSPNLSYAIYNFGTLKLSGTPTISGVDGDIYLGIGKVITIESGKPLTNTSPYSVYKSGAGAITSGWANMSGADPEDYFVSANSSLAVYDNGSEAALRSVINIRDNADNTSTIHTNDGLTLDVSLTRTWAADGYYSTLCLPFDLSSAQVSSIFGAGTELATLSSSSIDEETIYLVFESASSIEAGKPYLINPVNDVVNPQIAGVTIAEDLHDITTTYVDFKGIFSPTALAASENILCLGGSNSLGWPSAAGNLNGMRAYFEIHSLPAGAPALRHARFVAPGQHIPAAIDDAQDQEGRIEKVIEDGQVIIIRDGKKYNILGINK